MRENNSSDDPLNKAAWTVEVVRMIEERTYGVKRNRFPESDMSRSTEWRILKQLEEEGIIEKRRRGYWTKVED